MIVKNRSSKRRFLVPVLFGAAHIAACGGASEEGPPPAAPESTPMAAPPPQMPETMPATAATAAEPPKAAAPAAPALDPPVVITGFMAPETVLYDSQADVYLVSNVNGKPGDADGNGFISKVTPDGKVAELKWIDGSKKATLLDAPKGLAIAKGTLYVADITVVRMFDAKTGKAKGKVAVPGATFVNALADGPDGTIYVSDSGIKIGDKGVEPTGTDAIFKIGKKGVAEKLIADKDQLGGPNGLLADDKGVWAVTFKTGEIYRVGTDGKKEPGQKPPQGMLDGIVKLADGSIAVSSWGASAVYKGTPGGTFDVLVKDVKSPAGIGYDTKRNTLLIPLMQADMVQLQKLPGGPVAAPETPGPAPAVQAKGAAPAAPAATAKGPAPGAAPAAAAPPAPAAPAATGPATAPKPASTVAPAMTPAALPKK